MYLRTSEILSSRQNFPFLSLATPLLIAAKVYGTAVRWRTGAYVKGQFRRYALPCPVISIGNLEVGGTGKTPMAVYLARSIHKLGFQPVILSRGYKGGASKTGAVACDGRSLLLSSDEVGDEPYLMASLLKSVPVVVGADRVAVGRLAIKRFQPDVIILDDGFQHLRLHRDLDVVLLDAANPFGNGYLLPRGRLREPVGALARSHAVVLTRATDSEPSYFTRLNNALSPRPLFRAFHCPKVRGFLPAQTPISEQYLRRTPKTEGVSGKQLFVFSGLARNELFWASLKDQGADLTGTMGFDDHHAYCREDIERINTEARKADSPCLVTTDKDMARLPRGVRLPLDIIVMGVDIDFKTDTSRWQTFISGFLKQNVKQ